MKSASDPQAIARHVHENRLRVTGGNNVGFVPDAYIAAGADLLVEASSCTQMRAARPVGICVKMLGGLPVLEDANIAKTKYWPDGEEADRGIGCLLAKHRRHFPQNREPAPYLPPTVDPHTNREHDDLARNLRAHPLSQNLVHDPFPL